jgi:hypothetical protein
MNEHVEFCGIIIDINSDTTLANNNDKEFTINIIDIGKRKVKCQFYCPAKKSDCIYVVCQKVTNKNEEEIKDYYKILDLNNKCIDTEIKESYHKLAKQHHPDKNNGDDVLFKQCLAAYEVLSDEQKRKEYDKSYFKILKSEKYIAIKAPFILIAKDKESICITFINVFKIKYREAILFYNQVEGLTNNDTVYNYLTFLAEQWYTNKDQSVLEMFGDTSYDINKLLLYWYKDYNLRSLYLLGLTNKEIRNMNIPTYILYEKCITNPYIVYTIDINKADEILDRMNKVPNKDDRERGLIMRQLWKNLDERKYVCTKTSNLCKTFPNIKPHVESLKNDYGLVIDMGAAYILQSYKIETYIANYIINMIKNDPVTYDSPIDIPYVHNNIPFIRYKAVFTIDVSEDQMLATQAALDHKFVLIIGGAGVGKSTVIGQIVHNLELRNIQYALTGFTGKSIVRIRDITKKAHAATMHRMIYNVKILKNQFEVVIIDEISMVTTELLYQFLSVFKNIKQLICVGDINQLEPIDAGSFLHELIKSETVPTYQLTVNHRVYTVDGQRNGILLNANMIINHDTQYPFEFIETDNFNIIEGGVNYVYDIIQGCFNAGISYKDLTVITPYNRCLIDINKVYQSIYNHTLTSVTDSRGVVWKLEDRVMLTKNSSTINTFNGQEGTVVGVNKEYILVNFG